VLIFENLSILIDIQVGNEELDLATTESCESSRLASSTISLGAS